MTKATAATTIRERRPQWRGERQAVLVRLPVPLALRLRDEAARTQKSLSETVVGLISAGIGEAVQ